MEFILAKPEFELSARFQCLLTLKPHVLCFHHLLSNEQLSEKNHPSQCIMLINHTGLNRTARHI